MSITKTLLAGVAGTVLASGMAAAGEPMKLSTAELDQVTAGLFETQVFAFPSSLQGLTASFKQTASAGGSDTTSVFSLANFTNTVAASAAGTSTGAGTGGFVPGSGTPPLYAEGQFIFGGMQARTQVFSNAVF